MNKVRIHESIVIKRQRKGRGERGEGREERKEGEKSLPYVEWESIHVKGMS